MTERERAVIEVARAVLQSPMIGLIAESASTLGNLDTDRLAAHVAILAAQVVNCCEKVAAQPVPPASVLA